MKTAVLQAVGTLENLKIVDRPEPTPSAGEVLVRLRAASLNFRDLVVIAGGYGRHQRRENLVPLSDGAGEIAAVGPGVSGWRVGDRVVGCFFPDWPAGPPHERYFTGSLGGAIDGVACEYRVFAADAILPVPPHLSFVEAATLPCAGLTAWTSVMRHGAVGPGQAVLTQGTGGVSLLALQLARIAGADVIATSSSAAKLDKLRTLGATHTIDYTADAEWGRRVYELCAGGVDLVVEIGGSGTMAQSLRAVRTGGAISIVGVVTGARVELNVPVVIMKSIRFYGASVGSRDEFAAMLKAVAQHRMHPAIDRTFPLTELRAALAYLQSGRHVGKVCIEI